MFSECALLYDLVYEGAGKNYDAEADLVTGLLRERLPEAQTLLDVACGTGQHLARFPRHLKCTGLDLNAGLLAAARKRCPGATFVQGDMLNFDLGQQYDVVTCLFSSIGYMRTLDDLNRAVARMADHVRPGGLLVVELALEPERWCTDFVGTIVAERPAVSVVRMGCSARTGRVAHLELHYLFGTPENGVTHHVERHDLGLFTSVEQRAAVTAAGLDAEIVAGRSTMRDLVVGSGSRRDPDDVDAPRTEVSA